MPEFPTVAQTRTLKSVLTEIGVGLTDVRPTRETETAALRALAASPSDVSSIKTAFASLLDVIFRRFAKNAPVASAVPVIVAAALEVVRTRYADPALSLRDVSKNVSVSPCHLARLVTRATGEGFLRHLHQTRVGAARRLLRDSTLSVKQIAYEVGYRRTSDLDMHFKSRVGVTPTEFRRRTFGADRPEHA